MDKEIINALGNLTYAIEYLSNTLNKNNRLQNSSNILQSGDFSKQLLEINNNIKDLKVSQSKILDNTETLIKLQKEKKNDSLLLFGSIGENKKSIKDGISVISLIAGSILAIGLAFKLIGTVDWKSVLAISVALPMIAFAFEKIAKIKDLTPGKVLMVSLSVIGLSVAIMLSSRVLSLVAPISPFQALTVVFIAVAFGVAAYGLGKLLMAFKDINVADALKASLVLPIVLLALSVAIAASSFVLQAVQPIGLYQALTVVLIAAAFGVVSYGLGKLISAFKDIDPATALVASVMMPIVLVALSYAIVGASWYFSLIKPIGLFQALTAILISATFVVLSYAVKPLMKGVEGVTGKQIGMGTLVLLALTAAVVGASWLMMGLKPVSFSTIAKFLFLSISLSTSVVALALAVKVINKLGSTGDYIKGGLSILSISTTIVMSSFILNAGLYANLPSLSWILGGFISISTFSLLNIILNRFGTTVDYIKGGLSILAVSTSIMLSSLILSKGVYNKYPNIDWIIGVGLSLTAFSLGVLLLGIVSMSPTFYLGMSSILLISSTITLTSFILNKGSYDKYPNMEWVKSVSLIVGGFALLSSILGISSPLIIIGSATIILISSVILSVDKILSNGVYKNFPSKNWVNSVSDLFSRYLSITPLLALYSPLVAIGSLSLLMMAGSINLISRIFNSGNFTKYPNNDWVNGVFGLFNKFTKLIIDIKKNIGFFDIGVGLLKIWSISEIILDIDKRLSKGGFKNYPSKRWMDGLSYTISEFSKIMLNSSFQQILSERIKSIFGGGIDDIAYSIVKIDNILSKGNFQSYPDKNWVDGIKYTFANISGLSNLIGNFEFDSIISMSNNVSKISNSIGNGVYDKYPTKDFIDNTIYALQKFKDIQLLMRFDDVKMGNMDGLTKIVSNVSILAVAFDKLSKSMTSFSNSIGGIDMNRLEMVKGLSSNVILLSLMDPDMLNDVLDKIESKGGVFADLVKNFEESKSNSSRQNEVVNATPVNSYKKSDAQVLSEKVDVMTNILADISSVVGSKGTLKTYLNSIKEQQLNNNSNSPSINRSDRRLKNIISKVGTSLYGINIYQFSYVFDKLNIYEGIIAQELINTPYEGALILDKNGFYSVDYSKIDVIFRKIKTN